MKTPSKAIQYEERSAVTQSKSSQQENDPYAGSISASEFMRQIRAIQQSHEDQDVDLREAAKNYMNNLQCV